MLNILKEEEEYHLVSASKLSIKHLKEGPNLEFNHAFEGLCYLKLVLDIMLHDLMPKTYGNF